MKQKVYAVLRSHFERDLVLEKPKDRSFGHFATPIAFSLAKELRKSPMIIAQELADSFTENPMFSAVEAVKGYLNFRLSENFLNEYASWALNHENEFAKGEHKDKILLEFVSANPTGPLHIGHARGAIFGDVLLRLGRHLGYDITAEYYVNDAGNQIDLLGLSILKNGQAEILKDENVQWPEEYYKGEYIIDVAHKACEEFGEDIFKDELNIRKLALWGKDQMLALIKANLKAAGVIFDTFVNESELYEQWEDILELLKKNEGIYEQDGKLWLKSSEHKDEKDRVVVREDGRATYLAGDIIYHNQKLERNYDHYINIWGADHHGYIARVKAAVKLCGHDENKLEVLLAQMVSLLKDGEPYKMSKRAGNFILMNDVVEEIGSDALRFIFASKKSDTHLEFDVEDLKKQDSSNPIYYINYAHARVYTMLAKSDYSLESVKEVALVGLDEDANNLLFNALLLPEIIEDAFNSRQVQKLADYLKSLAANYHSFYNSHKILGTEKELALLKLSLVVALSIRVGLKLLGIEAKKSM